MKLGYGTYGMFKLSVLDAVQAVHDIGYDGVELAALPNAPASPDKLTGADRAAIRARLEELELELPALMLSLNAVADDQDAVLGQLGSACGLAHDLAIGEPPVLVTTAGGKAAQWETDQDRVCANIAAWGEVCEVEGLVLAIEPHVGGVLHRPEHAEEVRRRADCEAIRFNYDHSHFVLQDIPVDEAAPIMVPYAVATHLKDAEGDPQHVKFLLPGEGAFDYPSFFTTLHQLGYDGWLTVEVSGMIWNKPDYDPIAAAKFCYRTLADALREAGLGRG